MTLGAELVGRLVGGVPVQGSVQVRVSKDTDGNVVLMGVKGSSIGAGGQSRGGPGEKRDKLDHIGRVQRYYSWKK